MGTKYSISDIEQVVLVNKIETLKSLKKYDIESPIVFVTSDESVNLEVVMEDFVQLILKNLQSNGFPDKKVSMPTMKMYEVADNKGLSLNDAIGCLREQHQVNSEIGDEKIVFSKQVEVKAKDFPNINPDMMGKVQEMLSKMNPEELKKMQDQVVNMSDEEREEMLSKAKGMGLF